MADVLSGLARFPSLSKRWPRNCIWLFLNCLGFRVAPAVGRSVETAHNCHQLMNFLAVEAGVRVLKPFLQTKILLQLWVQGIQLEHLAYDTSEDVANTYWTSQGKYTSFNST